MESPVTSRLTARAPMSLPRTGPGPLSRNRIRGTPYRPLTCFTKGSQVQALVLRGSPWCCDGFERITDQTQLSIEIRGLDYGLYMICSVLYGIGSTFCKYIFHIMLYFILSNKALPSLWAGRAPCPNSGLALSSSGKGAPDHCQLGGQYTT